ncbi:hypothetical protein [Bacteroides oleiciplenus]|uniref:Immunity protein 30 domain-containing protein n=1 Tax=Bacteroides oleiciplenus YIT 12058 TaxID=742727 RepID=K9E360_9BACE|nr:hypothetical protein [Bacteroides oleiciplenus]EKU91489.1 hypothetical protein HMPREF9447_01679 [Bacteroides oleiciplenus YIT 12058]
MNTNEIISKINNANLQSQEDLQKVESDLIIQDNTLIEPLFKLLERFPFFNFGNPGNIVRYLERFANEVYVPLLYDSVRREPTEYNVWMVNRYLNTLDNTEKAEGIMILEEALQKDIDEGVKEWINDFLEEQKDE